MDLSKLNSGDTRVVRDYVQKKFKRFNRFTYSKSSRRKKCEDYYMAANGRSANQDIIQEIYQNIFGEILDTDAADTRAAKQAAKKPERIKIEAGAWLQAQGDKSDTVDEMLVKLYRWRDNNDYQLGPSFFADLETLVEDYDATIMDTTRFQTDFSAQCRASISSEIAISSKELSAQYDLMVGFEQSSSVKFSASGVNWGEVNAKLEQSFKAGVWSRGEAQAKLERLGFSVEVQAAIAMGAQLDIEGDLKWTKGRGTLALGGSASAFVGARASGEVKLSVSAREGIEAAIEADAFVGFSASAKGSCSFSYDGKEIVSASGKAAITFGAGAKFKASIEAPVFGPTKIEFGGNLTVGLGTEIDTAVAINFNEAQLASSAAFRQMVYWRTMARGYEMTLMNSDARNLFYLNKVIRRMEAERDGLEETIASYNKVPEEKRSLLMDAS